MGLFKVMLPFFLFITAIMSRKEDNCLDEFVCRSNYRAIIKFPFGKYFYPHGSRCAYPGFDMSCDLNGQVIQIGAWGEFSVDRINYITQEVTINDQQNCLPKRLLNLDLSGSPFRGSTYENFTFYNCSSEFSSIFVKPITCLSTLRHTIYANSSMSSSWELTADKQLSSTCRFMVSVMVPSRYGYLTDINQDLHLIWDNPDCRACAKQYLQCGFKSRESTEIKCFNPPPSHKGISRLTRFAICLATIVSVILIACYIAGRVKSYRDNNLLHVRHVESSSTVTQQSIISMAGLDESVIQSYPKTVLGESRRLAKPEDNTCSICLSEYQAKEKLKTIPECKHCFHATCIDEWLRRNVTCPLCRNCPSPLPLPT